MKLEDQQRKRLLDIGEQLLSGLEVVAETAQSRLSGRSSNPSVDVLGGGEQAIRNLERIRGEVRWNLERMFHEPFVARVVVERLHSQTKSVLTYYISRASVAGFGEVLQGAELATYTAPMGRLAELEPGDLETVVINRNERDLRVLERTLVRPTRSEGTWDALDDRFEFISWQVVLDSVRRFIEEVSGISAEPSDIVDVLTPLLREAEDFELVRQKARRSVIYRIGLRDQPVLDRYQGEVFRMPLDRQLFLLGPPGTGKTTTLIRRLAQKRTPGSLTDDEKAMLSEDLREAFFRSDSWVMFSPTELLKLYLREAFSREGVPAADANLRTWDSERLDLGRNVLRILRSAESRGFQLENTAEVLVDTSSTSLANLQSTIAAHVEEMILRECNFAIASLEESKDESVRMVVAELRRSVHENGEFTLRDLSALLDSNNDLQPEIKRLDRQIVSELNRIVNRVVVAHPGLLAEVAQALQNLQADDEADEEEDAESEEDEQGATTKKLSEGQAAKFLISVVRAAARAIAQNRSRVGGVRGRIRDLIGERFPTPADLAAIGADIVTLGNLRAILGAPRRLVLGVPRIYARFRQQSVKDGRLFRPDATKLIRANVIGSDEADVLILVMLKNARRLLEYGSGYRIQNRTGHDWLEDIKSRYLMQVFIDEATDFSAVQLACMLELAHPTLRSWFACGDFQQRVTKNGLKDRQQLAWVAGTTGARIEERKVSIGYRQSRELRELAAAIEAIEDESSAVVEAPSGIDEAGVRPILGEGLSNGSAAIWLAGRIIEVDQAIGKLPSIAVFVDGDELIEPLVAQTQRLLARQNIRIVGCKEGKVVGQTSEVRVFDVRHIKGLEFEAVFFLGIDRFAERMPDLFHRFLYVGVTRAATYLGVTCEGKLPQVLEEVRPHFAPGGWSV